MGLLNSLVFALSAGVTEFDISAVISDAVNSVQGDIFTVFMIVVPAIVAITGAIVAVKFGINWLKKLGSNK